MFEISQLKEKTLVELQEIAKTIGAKKYSQLKKLDLVYLILDIQAATPKKITQKNSTNSSESKPRRKRMVKKPVASKTQNTEKAPETVKPIASTKPATSTKSDSSPKLKTDNAKRPARPAPKAKIPNRPITKTEPLAKTAETVKTVESVEKTENNSDVKNDVKRPSSNVTKRNPVQKQPQPNNRKRNQQPK